MMMVKALRARREIAIVLKMGLEGKLRAGL
jgi:hypothetical protein